ncbi:MAG: carbon-phosphorus lyase [Pseudomonadota bacterium]|jgi:alpha-D-ribose 1-methylphosphonate 5-triphosphate synthase subunit PhnH
MTASSEIAAGFADNVIDSQAAFRTLLECVARPGTVKVLRSNVAPPLPLLPATAALILTLSDYETSIWLDAPLANSPDVIAFVRFHTQSRLAESPADADFAIVSDPEGMPPLIAFKQGSPEFPERSSTLLVQVNSFSDKGPFFSGPGIRDTIRFWAEPLPVGLQQQLSLNRTQFPCGVDLVFVGTDAISALPRSVRLAEVD